VFEGEYLNPCSYGALSLCASITHVKAEKLPVVALIIAPLQPLLFYSRSGTRDVNGTQLKT
jgi:hypothetical protein